MILLIIAAVIIAAWVLNDNGTDERTPGYTHDEWKEAQRKMRERLDKTR